MRFFIPGLAGAWRRSKSALCGVAVGGLLASVGGCSPAPPSSAELGKVVFDADQMPGAHKRFLLPEIKGKAGGGESAADGADHPPHEGHAHGEDPPGGK
ncbi:MAG TPA: hypothetical protein VMV10_11915 [Pirellulales bacterium]|nr:hypothetical protein [Pirellulales bacterium]